MRTFIIAISCLLLARVALAADLPIGSVRFKLGAEQDAVMKEAHAKFHVLPVSGSPDMFFLSESKPPNANVIGAIRFENGRLASIQRTWGHFSGTVTSVDVSKAIFAAIESAAEAAGSDAIIKTKLQRVPGLEFRSIYFDFPGRRVTVTTTEGDASRGGNQVSIEESISSNPR